MSFTQRRVWSLCFWGFTHFRKFFAYRNNAYCYYLVSVCLVKILRELPWMSRYCTRSGWYNAAHDTRIDLLRVKRTHNANWDSELWKLHALKLQAPSVLSVVDEICAADVYGWIQAGSIRRQLFHFVRALPQVGMCTVRQMHSSEWNILCVARTGSRSTQNGKQRQPRLRHRRFPRSSILLTRVSLGFLVMKRVTGGANNQVSEKLGS